MLQRLMSVSDVIVCEVTAKRFCSYFYNATDMACCCNSCDCGRCPNLVVCSQLRHNVPDLSLNELRQAHATCHTCSNVKNPSDRVPVTADQDQRHVAEWSLLPILDVLLRSLMSKTNQATHEPYCIRGRPFPTPIALRPSPWGLTLPICQISSQKSLGAFCAWSCYVLASLQDGR